jgi:hypothetical protein
MRSIWKTLNSQCVVWCAVAALMLATIPQRALSQSAAGAPAAQSSVLQGVTVKATLKPPGPSEGRWEIGIVLDTHSGDLSDDLVQSASLTTGDGSTFKPTSWTGAGPGGHHREGVLAFDLPVPRPGSIELRIVRRGESAPRIFRWQP